MVASLYKHIWCHNPYKRSKILMEGGGLTKLTLKNFLMWYAENLLRHPLVHPSSHSLSFMSAPPHSSASSHNDLENLQPPAHVHCTHINDMVVDSYKALSLKAKLKVCKGIEEQSDACLKKTHLNALDPANHPEPGSETACLFSIDSDNLKKLRCPTFALLFHDVMPSYLANWLFEHSVLDAGDLKCDSDVTEDLHIMKCCCMDGNSLKPHTVDVSADLQFTQLLYKMADCGMVPLPLSLQPSAELRVWPIFFPKSVDFDGAAGLHRAGVMFIL